MPSPSFSALAKSSIQCIKRLAVVPPKEPKILVGLDIGSSAIKAIALGARKGGGRRVIREHLEALDTSKQTDPSDIIRQAVDKLGVSTQSVNISVSGSWVIMRVVEMPALKPAEMKQALPFEAQRYLPFNLQDVIIDGVVLGPAGPGKMWVLIVACKKELIERRMDWIKRAGLEVGLIDVDALALANGFLSSMKGADADSIQALINVGAQLTNLVIFRGNKPYLIRDVPWGGTKLVRSAAEQLEMDEESFRKALEADEPERDALKAAALACESLVTELQLSFDYFENRFSMPPDKVAVSGGLSQAGGFLAALKTNLSQQVEPWTPVDGLPRQFAVAYGLGLRAA